MDVFDLCAKLSLDTSEYSTGLSKAGSEGGSFGSKIAKGLGTAGKIGGAMLGALATGVTVVSGAMVKGINDVASYGDEIDKSSQKLGVSSSFYQEWDAVLQHSGTSMSAMTGTFKTLSKAVQDGSEDQQKAFEAIGLSMDELSSMSTEEVFEATIKGLQGMEEGTERTALATQLLGRGAMEMGALLNTSAEDTQAMIDTVNELGGVLSEDAVKASARYEDSLQDLQTAITGAKNSLTAEFLPSVADMMDGVTKIFGGDSSGGMELIRQGLEGIQTTVEEAMPAVLETVSGLMPVLIEALSEGLPVLLEIATEIVLQLVQGIIDNLPMLLESGTEILLELVNGLLEMLPSLVEAGLQIISQLALGIAEALPELIPTIVDIILQIANTLIENVDLLVTGAIALMNGLVQGLINALPTLIEQAPVLVDSLVQALIENAPLILSSGLELMIQLVAGIIQMLPQIISSGIKIVTSLISGIAGLYAKLKQTGVEIFNKIKEAITSKLSEAKKWGTDMIANFIQGIKDKASDLWNEVTNIAKGIKDRIGFSEPKLGPLSNFHTYAPDMIDLFIEGVKANQAKLNNSVASAFDFQSVISRPYEMQFADVAKMEARTAPANGESIANNMQINVTLEGDAQRMFRVIKAEAVKSERLTGIPAFA